MIPLRSIQECKEYEQFVMEKYHISSLMLMEMVTNNIIEEATFKYLHRTVSIFCGTGNNGGDGFALARKLSKDLDVTVFWYGEVEKMTPETAYQFRSTSQIVKVIHLQTEDDLLKYVHNADLAIDCLIGLQSTNELRGFVVNIIERINQCSFRSVYAIDVPTGVNPLTGNLHQHYVRPTKVFTIEALKPGLISGVAASTLPFPIVIQLTDFLKSSEKGSKKNHLENEDIRSIIPERSSSVWKFDMGHAVVVAGSSSMLGAGVFVANTAMAVGAGLVTLISTSRHPSIKPEVMVHSVESQEHGNMTLLGFDEMKQYLDKATVIAIGPGLGTSYESIKLIQRIIEEYHEKVPIVVDADGLLAIDITKVYSKNVVLTPHLGECKRLFEIDFETAKEQYIALTTQYAQSMNCIIHTKGAPSITSNGEEEFWLQANAPSLATAGSGDVLTGLITGIIAQGVDTFKATGLAAYLHREAAKRFEKENESEMLTASKLIDYIDFAPSSDNWN
jgi:hydroxyethylthiazole kinase-like uncharacterized protein yjeF